MLKSHNAYESMLEKMKSMRELETDYVSLKDEHEKLETKLKEYE